MLTIATINAGRLKGKSAVQTGRKCLCKRELDWKKRLAMLLLSKIMLIFAEDMEKAMIPERDRLC